MKVFPLIKPLVTTSSTSSTSTTSTSSNIQLKNYLSPTVLKAYSLQGGYFLASNYATIYNFPTPPSTPIVIGVISLGGGLFGTLNNTTNILTNGDVQNYWATCGIPANKYPTVKIITLSGATNNPGSTTTITGATGENTLDVCTVGACCFGSNVTIILYIAPNSVAGFTAAFTAATYGVSGKSGPSNVISCSWGNPEVLFSASSIASLESCFAAAVAAGIPICAASGDYGASDGQPGLNVDYPSSSTYVISCGGTRLICPNNVYDASTNEVAWSYTVEGGGGGGGYSSLFQMPAWQVALKSTQSVLRASTKRASPDIAMNADPSTGVAYRVGGNYYIYGGTSIVAPAMAAYIGCVGTLTASSLYSVDPTGIFNDIVSGNIGGYEAVIKYDCCTGLGSFNGSTLAAALAVTPPPPPSTTRPPTTRPPTTKAPTTRPPTTRPPTTRPPTTRPPTTKAPTTRPPTTKAPTTRPPTTRPPTTKAPTTRPPTTRAPTTKAPTTRVRI